jgi:hypothetical protein
MFFRLIIIEDFDEIIVLFGGVTTDGRSLSNKISILSIIGWFGACFFLP